MSGKSDPKTGYQFIPVTSPPAPGDFCATGPGKTLHLVKENPAGNVRSMCGKKNPEFVPVLVTESRLGLLCESCLRSLEGRVKYLRQQKEKHKL